MTVSAEQIQSVKNDAQQNAAVSRASFIIKRLEYIITADLAKWQEVVAAIEVLDASVKNPLTDIYTAIVNLHKSLDSSELKAIIDNFEEWMDVS